VALSDERSRVESGIISMVAQGTRGLRDESQCPEGTDAYRGIIEGRVEFDRSFDSDPEVLLALRDGTISNSFRIRLELIAADADGFSYRFNTYCRTSVYGATASWIAIEL